MTTTFLEKLKYLDACPKGLAWVESKGYDFEEAWTFCESGIWLLWLCNRLGIFAFWQGLDFSANKVREMVSMAEVEAKLKSLSVLCLKSADKSQASAIPSV
jgi:hypothetical protein